MMLVACVLWAGLCLAAVLYFAWLTIRSHKRDIDWFRAQVDYLQQRGDRALDKAASLAIGQNVATALPAQPHHGITAETLEAEVRRMVMGDPEVAHAGQVSG